MAIRWREIGQRYNLGVSPRVLYAASGKDPSVAVGFGGQNVVHVDPDEKTIKALEKAGYTGVTSRVEDFTPGKPFDLIALYRSHIDHHEVLPNLLKLGGLIVTNNGTFDADRLAKSDELELIAGYLPSYYEGSWVDAEEARRELGSRFFAVENGKILRDVEPTYSGVLEEAKNQEGLFVFRKKPEVLRP